ncbi:MAG TPA: hypothetical protein VNV86_17435 [Candidatus Acidoferrum sp.]|jgi:hypothetical protein|nr:hypothetical protein [Candidatus Acidoferrum sp.]
MTAERWRLVARPAFLERACRNDGELRAEVENLLRGDDAPDLFLFVAAP